MSNERKEAAFIVTGGFFLGAVAFIMVYGFRVLDFTYDAWLLQGSGFTGDLTQHYLGWVFLRDSEWGLPLGLIDGLCYPEKISVIYTDSIPLFAIFFKLLSPILPPTFQYFGLWGLLCFAMQGGLGALLLRKYSKNLIFIMMGSLFFIFSPILVKRMFYHSALAGHWLILVALAFWVYRGHLQRISRKLILWSLLLVLTVLINLYFTPIVFGIMLCAFLEEGLEDRTFKGSLLALPVSAAAVLYTMLLFGAFYGGVSGKMGGLGVFSLNLNAFINSQGDSAFLPALPLAQEGQNEGYAYLGAGVLLLLAAAVGGGFLVKKKQGHTQRRKWIPRGIAVGVFTLLALSPVVTLNAGTLFTIPYPEGVREVLSIFRSSGRFIWPVYYLLVLWGLSRLAAWKSRWISLAGAVVFLGVQLFDLSPVWLKNRAFFGAEQVYTTTLQSEVWQKYAQKYRHIVFYPPLWNLYVHPDVAYDFCVYAHENGMTVNGTYFSRDLSEKIDPATFAQFEALRGGNAPDDVLYVFPFGLPGEDYGLKYVKVDGYNVGLK